MLFKCSEKELHDGYQGALSIKEKLLDLYPSLPKEKFVDLQEFYVARRRNSPNKFFVFSYKKI